MRLFVRRNKKKGGSTLKYDFVIKRKINVGELGTIYLMKWFDLQNKENHIPEKPFFCAYLPEDWNISLSNIHNLFDTDINEDGCVIERTDLYKLLEKYIDDNLSQEVNCHLYTEPEDAVFNAFVRVQTEGVIKKLVN